ncbi:hydroxyisourate hydrolase [Paenibacillus crassostreae]|uniref:5-hydroxyisourate hydrolase n=1 Tax=Paenibacillus crassostreae TaxID=1763538 RepID=A0A167B4Q3_9BACL|nr:hydroxyisourate hydrolase [Paenibacillus crassostreae]AOZ93170.1 hydroxyisourate hydrolase [Paenibacillus crassostreae]OAB71739.1 5-hydroxyisourate hydrolase [Paenibacillus crassostreae]
MNGRLTTHVLDLSRGIPAAGVVVQLRKLSDGDYLLLCQAVTNDDGRLHAPLLDGVGMEVGRYELLFEVGDYFRLTQLESTNGGTELLFLEQIPIRFNIDNVNGHYHIPLLVAPGGYSTYRGS